MQSVLALNPLAFWPLNELSGTTAIDATGHGYNGTLGATTKAPTIGQAGQFGNTCYSFDGGDLVNIYTAGLAGAFSGAKGTLAAWMKVYDSTVWGTTPRKVVNLYVDDSNYIDLRKNNQANQFVFSYKAGGTSSGITATGQSNTGWMHVGLTWDKTAGETGEAKAYINGVQYGSTAVGLGTWAGNLASAACAIGANDTTPNQPWYGWIQYVGLWDRALTATEMEILGQP